MSRTIVISAALGLAAVLGGTYAATLWQSAGVNPCAAGQVAGGDIGGPFTLTDESGRSVTDADVFTAPTILYFGYTFCPDICPTDTARNGFALEVLEERGIIANAAFITIDPARDTPDVVAAFTDNFHPRMLGLTGTQEQIDAAVREWRVLAQKDDSGDPEFYLMNHSTFSYLVMPGTGFAEFFNRGTTPEEMADTVACYVEQAATN
jgi:protein SCO1/2